MQSTSYCREYNKEPHVNTKYAQDQSPKDHTVQSSITTQFNEVFFLKYFCLYMMIEIPMFVQYKTLHRQASRTKNINFKWCDLWISSFIYSCIVCFNLELCEHLWMTFI